MVNKEILAFLDGKQKILDASFVFFIHLAVKSTRKLLLMSPNKDQLNFVY